MGHPRRLETGNRKRKTIAYPEVSLPPPAPPPFPPEEAGTSEVGKKYKNNPSAWVGRDKDAEDNRQKKNGDVGP